MSGTSEAIGASRPSNEHFITSTLPLTHGPLVKIRIEPSNREYTVSKNLLCAESPVFSAMFQGSSRESQEHTATLQEINGVLSIQSFEALLRWVYHRTVHFDETSEESCTKAAVELAKLAEMYGITRIEAPIAQYIMDIYATSPYLNGKCYRSILPDDHGKPLGTDLREGHPECPKFGADLLFELREMLDTLSSRDSATVRDPITGERRYLRRDDGE